MEVTVTAVIVALRAEVRPMHTARGRRVAGRVGGRLAGGGADPRRPLVPEHRPVVGALAVADDLAPPVDGPRLGAVPPRGAEALHDAVLPHEGGDAAVGGAGPAGDLSSVVDIERHAVGPAERAEVDGLAAAPQRGPVGA